ncbi:MAG TPA: outer membrane beta-barrel protein [Bacteroidales bacterium]|nr:outer membrane beta-barrel protein [Bacteroidales bacterium]
MKKAVVFFFITMALSVSYAQEEGTGEVYGKVFSNFHHSIQGEADKAFEIKRAYLGYDHYIDKNFSGHIKLDIGSPDDQSAYALLKRYAYFKNAYLKYQKDKLTVNFGLVDNFQFKMQEKFWQHRYIYRSFMDQHDFGASADIGLTAAYRFSDKITTELGIMDGEGYNSLQSDNRFLAEGALTFKPLMNITLRGFYSFEQKTTSTHTYAVFAGYKPNKAISLGGELNIKKNMDDAPEHDALGMSFYALYDFNSRWQIFGRYDRLTSKIPEGEETPWNIFDDGSAIITGVQYKPIPDVALSVNYQDWVPWASNLGTDSFLYLNMLYKL